MFDQRPLVIATKHAKEQAIQPVLEEALGVRCITSDTLDTDLLGTFTGEVERTLDPVATAREKCMRAMDASGCDLAVASEGSFGPHPSMPFVASDEELLVFIDRLNGLEIIAREISMTTNFAAEGIDDAEALQTFADKAQFPSHGLILRKARDSADDISKGITDSKLLYQRFDELVKKYGKAWVETDMRAMYNPTRMGVIADAARALVDLLQSRCPSCAMPGFTVTEVVPGLPCELCHLPTRSASRHLSVCKHCAYSEELRYPHGKTAEDPRFCEFCNP